MKKILLLGLGLTASLQFADVQAQTTWGTQIGKTWYDLQTNKAVGNRVARHADGSISAVWIEHCDANTPPNSGAFPNRGTGFNYLPTPTGAWQEGTDGTCNLTGSQFGINTTRVGWGEIVALPNNT